MLAQALRWLCIYVLKWQKDVSQVLHPPSERCWFGLFRFSQLTSSLIESPWSRVHILKKNWIDLVEYQRSASSHWGVSTGADGHICPGTVKSSVTELIHTFCSSVTLCTCPLDATVYLNPSFWVRREAPAFAELSLGSLGCNGDRVLQLYCLEWQLSHLTLPEAGILAEQPWAEANCLLEWNFLGLVLNLFPEEALVLGKMLHFAVLSLDTLTANSGYESSLGLKNKGSASGWGTRFRHLYLSISVMSEV